MKLWNFLVLIISLNKFKGTSSELYDDQPKILVNDGNLVFESADSKNITVKLKGKSRFFLNDIDVISSLTNVTGINSNAPSHQNLMIIVTLLDQIKDLRQIVHNQAIRLDELELGSNKNNETNGTALNDRQRFSRINRRITALQQKVSNLTERLMKDHCKSYPCQNGGTCFNLFDTYRCECPENYEGSQCTLDTNECAKYVGTDLGCQNGATCINTVGSYECSCTEGWKGKNCNRRKVDCLSVPQSELCGQGSCIPDNNRDGYSCICKQGWRKDNNSQACTQDVNECEEMRPHCSVDPKVLCINTPGSFVCGPCPSGYRGNGFYCEDIDECEVNNGGCSLTPKVECINTRGSYRCGQCPLGFEGDGKICTPGQSNLSNQCSDSSICNTNALCIQYPNSPPTCSCKYGFTGNGYGEYGCVPFTPDPCMSLYCRNGGTCVRNGTSAYCSCPTGTNPPLCDRNRNSCDPNPCKNGGNCTNMRFGPGFRCTCPRGFTGIRCDNQQSTCGGVLTAENGTLRYPTDPKASKYQHNSRCAWLIRTNITKVLNITFVSFNVEFSSECRYDWLQIHDGRSAASHIIGRFCGSNLPKGGNIISTHNQLYLWFRSDNSTAHDGFELTWESIDPVCGGEINVTTHGTISSPGSPGNYPINSDCEWVLFAPPGKRIQFLFYTLMIESHVTCDFDFLELHSGADTSAPSLGKFCNSTIPAPLITPGNVVTIHFHTDGDSTDAGFQIAYSVIEGIPGCGGVYTAPRGDLSSPVSVSEGTYKHNLQCDYVIRMPTDSRVRLEFKSFGLEESNGCKFDVVEIYEGEENSDSLLGRYCGTTMPPVITSQTNVVTIKFISDWSTSDIGFQLQYQLICGGIFTAESGIISSPNYPNNYDGDRQCEYDIIAPQGQVIVLNVLDFDIEQHSTCDFDYLQIFDSSTPENTTSLGRFCGDSKPGTFTSSFNHMHIRFATDASVFGRGFQANYTFVDVKCGGLIKDPKEFIKSPMEENGNGVYESNVLCKWLILAPKGYVIQMNVLNFELEHDSVCKYDYLTIYNNGSGNGEQIGPFCGTTIPRVITTIDNIATIVFASDASTSKDGFTIGFNFIDGAKLCGGNFHSTHGVIRSPGSPEYFANKECEWTITVPNGQQIEVSFKYFDVESHSSCRFDGLEVRNGGNNLAPLLGKFCGDTVPAPFKSMGNQLHFRFYSDSSRNGRGFEIEWDGTSAGCGGIIASSKGAIISPNYPLSYPHNSQCEWKIAVNEGSTIQIVFSDLDLEANSQCQYDYLEIFDGPDASARSFGRFCEQHPMHIETSNNNAMIRMNTDETHSGRGFHIKYSAHCNRTIEADTGIIESPNFPEDYSNNLDCAWTIRVSKGNRINIQFSHFSLENDNIYHNETNEHICKFDYVTLYDYDYETSSKMTQTQKSYCNKAPEPRISTTDAVVVIFHTDQAVVGTGFRLEWYNEGCGGKLTHPQGGFTSPNYPKRYENDYVCVWEIAVEYGYRIKLTIHDFDIERSSSCKFDSLTIAHDRSFNSSVITKICQSLDQPIVITSDGHQLFVKFMSDESHTGKGFNITYESIASDCGGVFTAHNGIIKTPSYPTKNYDNNKTCEWLLRTDESHRIRFQLSDFDIEDTLNCTKDFFEIIDPIFNETIWRGCGSELPNTTIFHSKRHEMLLRLKTDETVNAKGFIGNFSISCGARILVDDGSGELIYRKINENVECEWSIIATDPSKHVTLTFTYVETFWDNEENCVIYIEVFEGDNDALGPQRAYFCSFKSPRAIVSHGNALTVKFNSSVFSSASEFGMHYSVMDNACGGKYSRSIHSEFASPNYPDSSPLNSYCVWEITASEGNRLALEIKNFDVASSSNCNDNYLEIRKNNANGNLIGVYCGDRKPDTIESSQSYWIKYKTDESSVNNGFLAEFKYTKFSDLQGESGKIESPNFPIYFRKDHESTYRITVQQGSVIQLIFKEFFMDEEDGDDCYSNIQIYNGYDDTAVTLGNQICTEPPGTIVSESNVIFIRLHNGIHSRTRFQIEWKQIDRNITGSRIDNVCGDKIISLNNLSDLVNITSPGFPDGYEANLICEWIIVSKIPTYHPIIRFIDVDLEDIPECNADYVKVFGSISDGEWRELGKHCMMDFRERKVYDGTPNLKIEFFSDYSRNETGFAAILSLACGGVLTEPDGIIEYNASNIENIRFQGSCMWNITVRRGRKIKFEFLEIDLKNTRDGNSNYVTIKNGLDNSAPYLGIGQYNEKVDIPETSGNRAFVQYKVSLPFINMFKLRYTEVQHECGGQVTLSSSFQSSIISTPNYPNIPHPHIECTWIIIAPIGREVRVDFIDRFDLARDLRCEKEYVEFREGSTSAARLIGTYCGSSKPPTIYTRSNVLRIKFFTDISEPKNGFKANVSIGICGGTIMATGIGYLTSPKYPGLGAYPGNVTCDFRIIGPPNTLFSIKIIEIDLPNKEESNESHENNNGNSGDEGNMCDLSKDHFTIYSVMPDETSGELLLQNGNYCGNVPPNKEIISDSNEIMVRFKTFPKTNQLYKGFRIFYNASKLSCGGEINTDSGYITSIGYPSRTLNKAYCEWHLRVRKGRRIKLEFEDLDFVTEGIRTLQRITIYSDYTYSSRMMVISNNSNPGVIYSSDNILMITAWIRTVSQNRGFKIKFSSELPSYCEGDLNQNEGYIYPPNINVTSYSCTYIRENLPIIPSRPGTGTIAFYFSNLAVGRKVINCRFAATSLIILRDSLMDEDGKYLARICGNTTEKMTVLSPFPDIRFIVKQSPYFGSVNFTLYYKVHNCGGLVRGGVDPIVLVNSKPDASDYKVFDCAIHANYDEGFTIAVKIESLNLKLPCEQEYIMIYNGPNAQFPLLAKICGNEFDSTPILSQKESIYIEYHTDNFVGVSKNSEYRIKLESSSFGCGGILNHLNRRFSTPLYNKSYPPNTECMWEIRADTGYQVGLFFPERFFIEESTNCTKDYLEFYDFIDNDWVFMKRVCGRDLPKPVNSTSTKLRVLFHSDSTTNGDGFMAQWNQNCGGVITVDKKKRILSSPRFPRQYDPNLFCNYTFVTKEPEAFINLKFLSFDIEQTQGKCVYDNVTLYKFLEYSNPPEKSRIGVYCGTKNPGNFRYNNKIMLILMTDRWVERGGFQLEYSLDTCGGVVTSPTMITSPEIIRSDKQDIWEYLGVVNCVWNITAPADKKIILKFEKIGMEYSEYCNFDYIEVFNGTLDEDKYSLMKICNNLTIPPISIMNNEIVVKMRSEQSRNYIGFSALVIFQEKCDENIILTMEKPSYTIDKSNQMIADNIECIYTIIGDPLSVIRVSFSNMHLSICDPDQRKDKCSCDYIEILDGKGPFSRPIGRFCGHENPIDVISTSSALYIRLVTDSIRSSTSFKLIVTMHESPCGPAPFYNFAQNSSESITLRSPRINNKYLPNIRCMWVIEAAPLDLLEVVFNAFDLEDSEGCRSDSLKIEDDYVKDYVIEGLGQGVIYRGKGYQAMRPNFYAGIDGPISPIIYCGSMIPHDYYSQTNKIRIYFETDSMNEFGGFDLSIRKINACSRNYTALQGRLISNTLPESCSMTITVPENYTISLYFIRFFFYSNDCEKSFMKLYDGDFDTGALLKILCGYASPDPIFSTGNKVSIVVDYINEDNRYTRGNYDIMYVASEKSKGPGCGGEIFNYGGIFTSPMYPNSNRSTYDCIWNVRVPQNLVIALQFNVFDMGSRLTCDIDYVELMEENEEKEFVSIKKYCGDDKPAIYVSSKSHLRVHYAQTVHFAGTGWTIQFMGIHEGTTPVEW